MVNYMTGGKLGEDILGCDSHFDHHNHYVVSKVCNLVNSFLLVVCFSSDDDLGRLLAYLLEDFVDTFFEKVACV